MFIFCIIHVNFILKFFLHHWTERQRQIECDRLHAVRVRLQSQEDQIQESVGSDSLERESQELQFVLRRSALC